MLLAIDESLSLIGDKGKHSIYSALNSKFGISTHEIPQKIDVFSKVLENIFSDASLCIEIQIMKNIYEKIGESVEWQEPKKSALPHYVKKIRLIIQTRQLKDPDITFIVEPSLNIEVNHQ